jgi:hypothetical protein
MPDGTPCARSSVAPLAPILAISVFMLGRSTSATATFRQRLETWKRYADSSIQ